MFGVFELLQSCIPVCPRRPVFREGCGCEGSLAPACAQFLLFLALRSTYPLTDPLLVPNPKADTACGSYCRSRLGRAACTLSLPELSSVDMAVPEETSRTLHARFVYRMTVGVFTLVSFTLTSSAQRHICILRLLDRLQLVNLAAARAVIRTRDQPPLGSRGRRHDPLRDVGPPRTRFSDRGHDLSHGPAVRVWEA
jgi:hypothetical protein